MYVYNLHTTARWAETYDRQKTKNAQKNIID